MFRFDARLMGNGGEVEHRISGAANGQQNLDGIGNGFPGHNLGASDVLFHQFHDLLAGTEGRTDAVVKNRRNHSRAGQSQTHGFRQTTHGVGSAEIGAGAASWFTEVLQVTEFLVTALTNGTEAHGLYGRDRIRRAAIELWAAEHRTTVNDDDWHIQATRHHHKGRHDLIAGT